MKFRLLLLIVLVSFTILGKSYLVDLENTKIEKSNGEVLNLAVSNAASLDPVKVPTEPVRLIIPTLKIDTLVENVGNDEIGRMDIPSDDMSVAWWKFGQYPGGKGNAVIAGHFDTKSGGPAVFYQLGDLNVGDDIQIIDSKGNLWTFKVKNRKYYKESEFPLDFVFGAGEGKNLNLITCAGTFNKVSKNYSDRLVVSASLVE